VGCLAAAALLAASDSAHAQCRRCDVRARSVSTATTHECCGVVCGDIRAWDTPCTQAPAGHWSAGS
jgi:hypothetical protein